MVEYLYNEILHSNKKNKLHLHTLKCSNMNESHRDKDKQKKPDTKDSILWFHLYENSSYMHLYEVY